jgi:hypothetical protein
MPSHGLRRLSQLWLMVTRCFRQFRPIHRILVFGQNRPTILKSWPRSAAHALNRHNRLVPRWVANEPLKGEIVRPAQACAILLTVQTA